MARSSKQEHFTNIITRKLNRELEILKNAVAQVEGILNADLLEIEYKAIKTFEAMQKIQFDSEIFRDIIEMKKS